jgi:hypothetical protein
MAEPLLTAMGLGHRHGDAEVLFRGFDLAARQGRIFDQRRQT